MTVGGIGVRPTVDRGARGRDTLVSPSAHQDENGSNNREQQEQTRDRDADREAPL